MTELLNGEVIPPHLTKALCAGNCGTEILCTPAHRGTALCSGCGRDKWGAVQLNAEVFPKVSRDGTGTLCRKCGKLLHIATSHDGYHPNCEPATFFEEPPRPKQVDPFDDALRRDLTDMINYADQKSDRSVQISIGPSELGDPCDRKMAYRLAGVPAANVTMDNWPAIVGTSIHEWLAREFNKIQSEIGAERFTVEQTVHPTEADIGHSDLYDNWTYTVLDWKTVSPDNMRKMRSKDIRESFPSYVTQVNLYGLGQVRAGRRVDRVGIVVLPRSGWLSSMYVWTMPYDESIALEALARRDALVNRMIEMDVIRNPHLYAQIPAVPSRLCSWCPWYRQGNKEADGDGCPGR